MKAIGLYVNLGRPHAAEAVERVREIAQRHGVRVAICEGAEGPHGFPAGCELDEAELLVTVGGDGTLLRGARIAHPRGLPILGVNTGRLGFLTEIEADAEGFAALERVFRGEARIEERVALHARVVGDDAVHFAINDVVVRRGAQARLVPFGLVLDGEAIAHIPSDGVIVATPMGSTGYFLSAGGPIVHPRVDALGVSGLMPHTLFARPLLVPSASTIEISCDDEIARANLETDGIVASDLQPGARVVICRAPAPVLFARIRPRAFFKRLEDKLLWGVPIKR
ncbi:MAG: NAD(+)/NADH kinase [Candidatus Eremiobacteraeota bacterium]|nr:NAD(+)/NADH kinase [Candidatus Eremiobacteraeota bacterium]